MERMIEALAVALGVVLVVSVLADMVNTLVTTNTAEGRWWMTRVIYVRAWRVMRRLAVAMGDGPARDRVLATFAPVSVLLLLVAWTGQQIIGFGLIWWGVGGIEGMDGLGDSLYFSGVVFFTVGFGEMVPAEAVPRAGAIFEAFSGVLTGALVIGYLPALYSAYSERERKLMTLDDGTETRITPTSLVLAWSPDADVDRLCARFAEWEDWVAGVIETHSTFPMLSLFRSHHRGQSWITALGLVTDAAMHCEVIVGAAGREPYWMLRRSTRLLQEVVPVDDLAPYRQRLDEAYVEGALFRQSWEALAAHGFDVLPFEEARERAFQLRSSYDAQLEALIDSLVAPRGFWGHTIGHSLEGREHRGSPDVS